MALLLAHSFPEARLYTSLYDPEATFAGFAEVEVITSPLQRWRVLQRHHRLGLPLYARSFSRALIDADVTICSSSGWAHGVATTGAKVVYCHAPARWLYQRERYVGHGPHPLRQIAARGLGAPLRHWDRRAAATATTYLANSTVTASAIARLYGRTAEVLPPPPALRPEGPQRPVEGLEPGYLLCVARLLAYKNVDQVLAAGALVNRPVVVVGDGPEAAHLAALARPGDRLLGRVDDETLRWLYANASLLVAASYEDYGLTPLEAAASGVPTVALGEGGYLDTIVDGETGLFADAPTAGALASAITEALGHRFDSARLRAQADRFSADGFSARLHAIVESLSPLR